MLLRRSLPFLSDLRIPGRMSAPLPANRHRRPPCKTCTKPANPLNLTLYLLARYPESDCAKPIAIISLVLSGLASKNGAFFIKNESNGISSPSWDSPPCNSQGLAGTPGFRRDPGQSRRVIEGAVMVRRQPKTCVRTELECALKSAACLANIAPAWEVN